jgi:hypothetical protein
VFLDEEVPTRWFSDWRVGYPTDGSLVERIAAWRDYAGSFDASRQRALLDLIAATDAI